MANASTSRGDRITSDDVDVLRQMLEFVKGRMSQEAERGRMCEGRATAMLAIFGILAGLVVPSSEVVHASSDQERFFLYIVFVVSLLFFLRGTYYAMRVIAVSRQYRLKVQTVYDLQTCCLAAALREEISAMLWEYEILSASNTAKLFSLNRSQRNGVLGIFMFAFFGLAAVTFHENLFSVTALAVYVLAAVSLLLLLFSDKAEERFGIWSGR